MCPGPKWSRTRQPHVGGIYTEGRFAPLAFRFFHINHVVRVMAWRVLTKCRTSKSRLDGLVVSYSLARNQTGMSGMPEPTDKTASTKPQSSASGDPRSGRRRLLQGALAGAPVLMTLVSRPVLAQQCQTPSGFVSANASHPGALVCSGNGPTYWFQNQANWPSTYKPNDNFKKYFSPDLTLPGNNNPKLEDVLNPLQTTNDVARYLVAALLNAGPPSLTPVLSANDVKNIWTEFATTGSFSPSSGVHWNANEIVEYVRSTTSTT
jgi:hypothetical protein